MNRQSNTIDQTTKEIQRKQEEQRVDPSEIQSIKRTSIIQFENEDNKSLDPPPIQRSTKKLIIHQFHNVYPGMTNEEWIKARNAFIDEYFKE